VLGLSPTATDKEIAKRVSELLIYAEMGKKVNYETDFEFLGDINRSTENINSAIKKIEKINEKIFYSLLWFEITDNTDLQSIYLIKQNNYDDAIKLLENEIFSKCPVVYSNSKFIIDVLKEGKLFKEVDNERYSIKSVYKTNHLNHPLYYFPKNYIVSTKFSIYEMKSLTESIANTKVNEQFQISCRFKWQSKNNEIPKKIGFSLFCLVDEIKHQIIISSDGLLIIEEFPINISPSLPNHRVTERFDKKFFKDVNFFYIKKLINEIEVWLNDIRIYKNQQFFKYSMCTLMIQGSQTLILENLFLSELEYKKRYSKDIELNELNYSNVKNLSLIFLLKTLKHKDLKKGWFYHHFELVGNFFNQDFGKIYLNKKKSNSEFIFTKIIDLYIAEFYKSFKEIINSTDSDGEVYFCSPFRFISKEAEKKAYEIVTNPRLHNFEQKLEKFTQVRIQQQLNYKLITELYTEALEFLSNYSFYGMLPHKIISDKIAKELLESAIQLYNSHKEKSYEILTQTLTIINFSAELAMNGDLRKRINENLRIISKSHIEHKISEIDFNKKERMKYIESVSYKGTKTKDEQNNIEIEINNLLNEFNNGAKQVESVYDFFHKCSCKLSVLEKEIGKDNLRFQNINSQIVTSIITFFFEILSNKERELKGNNIIQEVEFIILLEKGLNLFKLMNSYPMTPVIKERYERHFNILKEKKENFESDEEKIKKEYYKTTSNRQFNGSTEKKAKERRPIFKSLNTQIIVIGIWGSIFLAIYLISVFNNKSSETITVKKESQWKGFQLTNGSAPYSNFFGQQVFDFESDCWLKFKNNNKTDAIVCLENVYTKKTIRNTYIRAGTNYLMENIPSGTYKIKTFYGNDWNPHKTLNNGQISGAFEKDFHFSISDKTNDLITLKDDGYSYSTGEITLYTVPDGNMNSRRIDVDEFFN